MIGKLLMVSPTFRCGLPERSSLKTSIATTVDLVHGLGVNQLTLIILIALAPLSWSNETLAFYCERDAVHERLFADSIESTGWIKTDLVFGRNERSKFSVKIDSERIEVVEHPFFGELELATKKFNRFEHLNGTKAITVEGLTDGIQPFSFRLSGFEEKGTFPYMLARSGFSHHPFLNYDVGMCSKL